MRTIIHLVGLLAIASIAGCSTGAPGSSPGPTSVSPTANPTGVVVTPSASVGDPAPVVPDPCTFITQEEASTAVAAPVAGGVNDLVGTPDLGDGRTCAFTGTGDGQARVEVFANPGELYDTYKLQQSQFGQVTDLAGAGEKAFTVGNYECDVVKGALLMRVVLSPGDKYATDPEPRMIQLCRIASGRL
ncbi:MAG: hypothetical protein ABI620_08780 [Chloroflexota bacterium]